MSEISFEAILDDSAFSGPLESLQSLLDELTGQAEEVAGAMGAALDEIGPAAGDAAAGMD